MNLYLVVSESLETVEWEDRECCARHVVHYRICELVVARGHGHARFMAWKHDDPDGTFPCFEDMPKFAVRLKKKNMLGPARVLDDAEVQAIASDVPDRELYGVGNAPHIGLRDAEEG